MSRCRILNNISINEKGIIVVLSGFSGAGKGTIMKNLLKKHGDSYSLSISATTRNIRQGEEDGREYFFKSKEEFEALIEDDAFMEYACFNGNYYGTLKDYVNKITEEGKDILLEIEVQGALQIKEKYPNALLLFVTPPGADELKNRLVGRGTENEETVKKRLAISVKEAEYLKQYDYVIINDDITEACDRVHNIIQTEHLSIKRNSSLIDTITNDLSKYKEE